MLTWMASRRDPEYIRNIILALNKRRSQSVETLYYIYTADQSEKMDLVRGFFKADLALRKINLHEIRVELDDLYNHKEIIDVLVRALTPLRDRLLNAFVNISSGTSSMNAAWLILKSANFFGDGAHYISTQKPESIIKNVSPKDEHWREELDELLRGGESYEVSISRVLPEPNIENVDFDIADACFNGLWKYKVKNDEAFSFSKTDRRKEALDKMRLFSSIKGVPLLLMGERGVGKSAGVRELVGGKRLVSVACGTWDSNLAETTIFGHAAGAFTGAKEAKAGLLEDADGGVLFMDEIQDLPRDVQRKLLQTIQEKDHPFRRVGENKVRHANVEFIFATNKSVAELMGVMDPDFFDRISFFTVEIPSLRECKEDIEKDWDMIWNHVRTGDAPETFPLTKEMRHHFSRDVNLQGNYRSLQIVAYHIIAWNAWNFPERVKSILADIQKINEQTYSALKSGNKSDNWDFCNFEDLIVNNKCDWKGAEDRFKRALANWAYGKYGTWEKAAKNLRCTKETLMKNV